MFYQGSEVEKNAIMDTAERMCVAARTAPKAKGIDYIVTAILTDSDKDNLAAEIDKIGYREGIDFFVRDAECVRQSVAVVLIGTKLMTRGVPYCGFCGFKDCSGKVNNGGVCFYDSVDLGIAIGSAVSVAADNRVDNRVMFSVGRTALDMKLLGEEVKVMLGIPLTTKGKDIYFDRKAVVLANK
jgi:uncharacterized ferredoxin-like protein